MSSTDQDPTRENARRKFDEVASLFGSIVPPPGSPVRPRVVGKPSTLPQASDSELERGSSPRLTSPPALRSPLVEPVQFRPQPVSRLPSLPSSFAISPGVPAPPFEVGSSSGIAGSEVARPEIAVPEIARPEVANPVPPQPATQKDARSGRSGSPGRRVKANAPWPDAFVPRPNYQSSRRANAWYWLFLIPFAIVVAVAITLVDPRTIRNFIDQTISQFVPGGGAQVSVPPDANSVEPELVPPPAGPAVSPVQPESSSSPAQAAPETPPATPGDASPAVPSSSLNTAPSDSVPIPALAPANQLPPPTPSPTLRDAPTPAQPTATGTPGIMPAPASESAPAAPPQAASSEESSGAPAAPAPQAEQPSAAAEPSPAATAPVNAGNQPPLAVPDTGSTAPSHIIIYYRRRDATSEGEARRVAAKIGNAEVRVQTNLSRSNTHSPLIYYFNPSDRETATALARTLAGDANAAWIVRAGQSHEPAGVIDIVLP